MIDPLNDTEQFPLHELEVAADYLQENGFALAADVLRVLAGQRTPKLGNRMVVQRALGQSGPLSNAEIACLVLRLGVFMRQDSQKCNLIDGDKINLTYEILTPSVGPATHRN